MSDKLENKMSDNENLQDSLGFYFGYIARSIKNAITARFNELGYRVTSEQWHVMMFLWIKEGRSQHEITEMTTKEKTTIARICSGLERRQLIKRVTDYKDKRQKKLYLTEEGKKLQAVLIPLAKEVLESSVKGLTEEEIAFLKVIMRKISRNFAGEQNPYSHHGHE